MHIVCHRMLYVVCHAYHAPKRSKPRVDIQGVGGYYATLGIRTLTIFWMELPATSRSLLLAYSMHSIHPRATFAVGIWWTVQMPVLTFLSSNRRYEGWRCFFSPSANTESQRQLDFWHCQLYPAVVLMHWLSMLEPQLSMFVQKVKLALASVFFSDALPLPKICSFADLSRFYDANRRHLLAAGGSNFPPMQHETKSSLSIIITVYHHHCLSSSVFLIILYIASDIHWHCHARAYNITCANVYTYGNHTVCISKVRFTLVFVYTTLYNHMYSHVIWCTDTHWHVLE